MVRLESNLVKKIKAFVITLALLFGMTLTLAAPAQALNVYYYSKTRCLVGVYPVVSYLQWYKMYDYSASEEFLFGYRDYSVYSHTDPPRYNVKYVLSYCNSFGYIVP
jgi:hypothetical protein